MAFEFDWTPLAAVGRAAIRAGRNQGQRQDLEIGMQMQTQHLADARARDELRFRKEQADRGFKLQLADASRRERELNMRAQSMTQDADRYQQIRNQRESNLRDWESMKDSLNPEEYTRGLISIRSGQVPPQLREVRAEVQSTTERIKDMDKVAQIAGYAAETLKGYYQTPDGAWMKKDWIFDNKITDTAHIAELNQSSLIMQQVKAAQEQNKVQYNEATQAILTDPQRSPAEKLQLRVTSILTGLSEEERPVHMELINEFTRICGDNPEAGLQMYMEEKRKAEERERAKVRNNGEAGAIRSGQGGRMY